MEALTLWQPYAWAVGAGCKLVENRTWAPNWRRLKEGDDLAIHGGQHAPTREDLFNVGKCVRAMGRVMPPSSGNELGLTYGRGRIVAVVTFAGVVRSAEELEEGQRMWWIGPIGWRFTNVRQLNLGSSPTARGHQALWPLPAGTEDMVRHQLRPEHEGQLWRKTA